MFCLILNKRMYKSLGGIRNLLLIRRNLPSTFRMKALPNNWTITFQNILNENENQRFVKLNTLSYVQPLLQRNMHDVSSSMADHIICSHRKFITKIHVDKANKSDRKSASIVECDPFKTDTKLTLLARFKLMYKQYWYVLIPVHLITSVGWMGAFYYLSKSGVDIAAVLTHLHVSESITEKLNHSDFGHWAVAYLCYKVATPVRYAITLGGTTAAIKYFVSTGQIKPMPSKKDLVRMCEKKIMYSPSQDQETITTQKERRQPQK